MLRFILFISIHFTFICLKSQIDVEFMDTTIRPQDDFYNYVNGGWMRSTIIPPDKTRIGSFELLRDRTDSVLKTMLKDLISKSFEPNSESQKLKDFYDSYTNLAIRNQQKIRPLYSYFDKIDKINSIPQLLDYLIELNREGKDPFIGFDVGSHMKNSQVNAVYLGEFKPSLGRNYYQKFDINSKAMIDKYEVYIKKLIRLINPSEKDTAIYSFKYICFEKNATSHLLSIENQRNSNLQYNPIAVKDLKMYVKNIDLAYYLSSQKVNVDSVIVPELAYLKIIDKFMIKSNLNFLKYFLKIKLLNNSLPLLSEECENLYFDFYGKSLNGQKKQKPLEKRALDNINRNLGELLGKEYIKTQFSSQSKNNALMMVDYIKKSFATHIENLDWMSPETKKKALIKLNKFTVKIGYPNKWKDYSSVYITPLSYFDNIKSINQWQYREMIAKIGQNVDKSEWGMNPQTINAYYNPSYNEIVFPAAILQPPFYDLNANPAYNFGGIGAVIGHEISHGFDDSGCDYDGDGNLNNWWTDKDKINFEKAAKSLVDQYDTYEPIHDHHVNGQFTLGENIADLGGVSVAYDALKLYIKDKTYIIQHPSIYSPEQEFFMSWAKIWQTKNTEADLKNRLRTDSHSPGYYRANGPLVNTEGFYSTYNLISTDKMYKEPKKRIKIW